MVGILTICYQKSRTVPPQATVGTRAAIHWVCRINKSVVGYFLEASNCNLFKHLDRGTNKQNIRLQSDFLCVINESEFAGRNR